MLTTAVQRWRAGRDSYRPAGETIATSRFAVARLERDTEAKVFVTGHHYSASYPAARFRFGLFENWELVGVAVFSEPFAAATKSAALPGEALVELSRFVLLDRVPANGETWMLARCWELLRSDADSVLSFADPMRGHIGTIYQAHNAVFLGQAKPRTIRVLPGGKVLSARAIQKIRAGERGWRYSAALLEHHGAEPLENAADGRPWLATWLPRITRCVRHPGCLRYAWALDKRLRKHMPVGEAYPKLELAAGGGG